MKICTTNPEPLVDNDCDNLISNLTCTRCRKLEKKKKKKMKFAIIIAGFCLISAVKSGEKKEKSWKDKDIMDMTDADMERILDQWEEGEDPLEPDELPEHLRPLKPLDLSKFDPANPDDLLRATKMGKSVMMFVDVKQEISETDAENIMKRWQGSLQNNHIVAERYPIEGKRTIFMFKEGSQAIDAKNFLIEQSELDHITLEGQTYRGKFSPENGGSKSDEKKKKKSKNEL